MIAIAVDSRERDARIEMLLAAHEEIHLSQQRLPWGDFAIGRIVGIERKASADLAASIVDGRLFRQLIGLRKYYARPLLLVEGLVHGEAVAGVPWCSLRGALVSATTIFGVPILYATGPDESAELILTAARQRTRATADAYARPGYRPRGWRRRALYILQGLSRIGPVRAAALLETFGSVRAVMMATEAELTSVTAVGPKIARSILESTGPPPPYEVRRIRPARPGATQHAASHDAPTGEQP